MSELDSILYQYLINYGLAGIVIYIFYKLMSNELRELKASIDRLTEIINKLYERLK